MTGREHLGPVSPTRNPSHRRPGPNSLVRQEP